MTDFPTSFLMWTNKDPKYPNSFIIKTNNQKLLGLVRTDKNGTTYWKFKERSKKKVIKQNSTEPNTVVDNLQKFQQRQTKTESLNIHGNNTNNSEQSTVNQQSN